MPTPTCFSIPRPTTPAPPPTMPCSWACRCSPAPATRWPAGSPAASSTPSACPNSSPPTWLTTRPWPSPSAAIGRCWANTARGWPPTATPRHCSIWRASPGRSMTCCSPRGKIAPRRPSPDPNPMLPSPPQRGRDRAAASELVRRAQTALAGGGARAAIDLLRQAIALDPADPELALHLGNLLVVQGDAAAAIATYERALQVAPEHAALQVNLGITLGQTGDVAGAERCFNEVLRREPAHAGALGNLAQSLFQRAAFTAALPHYDRLLVAMPAAEAEILNNRGVCQQNLGDRAGAEQSFHRALALEPHSAAIAANLGLLLFDGGHLEAAKPALERALALNPRRALVAAQLFNVDLQLADWKDFERRRDELVASVATLEQRPGETVPPYVLLAVCDDPALQCAAARRWAWPAGGEEAAVAGRAP